ncbi:hypothetical protein [Polaribacter sp. IC073]|uniref:hypothetical protein n=1 Tax=Polaribacter sp. IC073 TaxID=2508540 RepID=UPI0011BD6577|nr:hypothetical protein [Polaribacter sp. IC073]TXD49784.1 hypothetical protein ES045_00960 [Polaribacter sp. IC073]
MKKIILLLTVFSMVFTSCEPLEDINAEADAQPNPIVGDAEYTLTGDDYESLGFNYGSFNSVEDAKENVPGLLANMFPVWGNKSSAVVSYKLYVGNAFKLNNYELSLEDYNLSGSDLLGFESNVTPGDYLGDIVSANYSSSKEGDYVSASYFQYTGSAYTVTPLVSFEENFDYGLIPGDLTTVSLGEWVNHSGASNQLLYTVENLSMTDYPSSDVGGSISLSSAGSEDVNKSFTPITSNMVYSSALINLSEIGNGTYFFHLMEEDGSFNFSARLGAKDDGSGNILFGIGASSSSLTYGATSFDLNTTYLVVTSYNIDNGVSNMYVLDSVVNAEPSTPEATSAGNAGNSANRIGVRQGGGGPTGVIDGIRVANTWSSIMSNETLEDEVVGEKESLTAIYNFDNGEWKLPSDNGFYTITDADFVSMGIENFGSSTPAENYLSAFLNIRFPYAQDGKELDVLYNYVSSSSGAQVRGNSYTKTNGVWVAYNATIETSLQFGHDGKTWVPDNTIKYTLIRNADYEYMASQLTAAEYDGLKGNLGTYGDFDYNWSDAQINFALILFLEHLDPNAAEGQKYLLTYVVYDNGENDYNKSFIKTNGAWVIN